jgi:FAD/FMN-containing dehydrogenase
MVDEQLLRLVDQLSPAQLKDVIDKPLPKIVLLVEYDSMNARAQKRAVKKADKTLQKYAASHRRETNAIEQEKLWRIRHASATVVAHTEGNLRAIPFIEDGVVPVAQFEAYITGIYELFRKYHLNVAIWGHAGDGNLHIQPFLDLSQVGDRQKVFKLADEYYSLVIKLGGTTSGEHGDGRLRAPFLPYVYGKEMYAVLRKIKECFDPHNILNPGVKFGTSTDDLKGMLRQEYSLGHLYNHLPRT